MKKAIIVAFAFLAWATVNADAATILAAVTAEAPIPPATDYCSTGAIPANHSSFLTTDNQVWFVFQFSGGIPTDQYSVQWSSPNGLYTTYTLPTNTTGGCWEYLINITSSNNGNPSSPASQPGSWRVSLILNGQAITSRLFTLLPPPPTLQLSSTSASGSGNIGTVVGLTPSPITISSSNSTPITFQVRTQTKNSTGGNWIQYSLNQSTTPAQISISANMTGFAPGTYAGTVTIQPLSPSGISPVTIALSVNAIGVDRLQLTYTQVVGNALTLTYPSATGASISVTSSASGIAGLFFSATATMQTPAGGSWLQVTQNGSQTNTTIIVSAVRGSLTPGTYQGRIDVYDSNNNDTPVTVVFVVQGLPTLSVQGCSPLCSASSATGQTNIAIGSIFVSTSDPGQPINFSITPSSTNTIGPNWLSATVTNGSTGSEGINVSFLANTSGLATGTYNGSAVVTPTSATTSGPITVRFGLTVTGGATLQVTWSQGQAVNQSANQLMVLSSPSALTGTISVTGGITTLYDSYSVGQGSNWLQVVPTSSATPGALTPNSFNVIASTASLQPSANPYQGRIDVFDSSNNPTSVYVNLTVESSNQLQLVPVSPCRIVDTTATPNGALAGPILSAGTTRTIPMQSSPCVPPNAAAYSLNITVTPKGELSSLTVWPTGLPQPNVSTMTAAAGSAIASAAIVPAGASGSINVNTTDDTDVVIDLYGYFIPPTTGTLQFFPMSPCRVLDTRPLSAGGSFAPGVFGPPSLVRGVPRSFPIAQGRCPMPAGVSAYSFNLTLIPQGPVSYMTAYPTGSTAPPWASTMNSWTGAVLANAAIVQAGTSGAVSFFATDTSDLAVDINGYFAPPGPGGLNFYSVNPCRLVDTRSATGDLAGPAIGPNTIRNFPLMESNCGLPNSAAVQAYSLSVTAYPQAALGFLALWPGGQPWNGSSTLDAWQAQNASNAALVPAGTGGAINVLNASTAPTNITVDTAGYFGP